jgi:hypothetical protein
LSSSRERENKREEVEGGRGREREREKKRELGTPDAQGPVSQCPEPTVSTYSVSASSKVLVT